jgi:hypothetical protein
VRMYTRAVVQCSGVGSLRFTDDDPHPFLAIDSIGTHVSTKVSYLVGRHGNHGWNVVGSIATIAIQAA